MARWHIGHNVPGYLPESDVECIEGSKRDAARAVRLETDYLLETFEPDDDVSVSRDPLDAWIKDGSLGIHVWAMPCETPDECSAAEQAWDSISTR